MEGTEEIKKVLDDLIDDKDIPDELRDKLMPIIKSIDVDAYQYAQEEKRLIEISNNARQTIGTLLAKNIYSIRGFLLTLTSFSLAATGVILPILTAGNQSIFKNTILTIVGIVCFVLAAFTSIIYLLTIHIIENNSLSKRLEFNIRATQKIRDKMYELYEKRVKFEEFQKEKKTLLEENRNEEAGLKEKSDKNLKKKDWWAVVIVVLFLSGFIFSALSIINLN